MTSEDLPRFQWNEGEKDLFAGIDTSVPHSARVWNYWLGGKDCYPVDKEAADCCAQWFPGIGDLARSCRYFLARAVAYLAGPAGVRQFLDIGVGLPAIENTHEIAQRADPGARVVYADSDPMVLAFARALLTCGPPGSTGYLDADLTDPAALIAAARELLDFSQPVAILLINVLGHIGDPGQDDDQAARAVVSHLTAALPPGGYLAICDGVSTDPHYQEAALTYNENGAAPYHLRSPGQIAGLFGGLDLVPPGVVPVHRWRPDHSPFVPVRVPAWGGIAKNHHPSRSQPQHRAPETLAADEHLAGSDHRGHGGNANLPVAGSVTANQWVHAHPGIAPLSSGPWRKPPRGL